MATAARKLVPDTSSITSSATAHTGSPVSLGPWNNKVLIAILGVTIGTGGIVNAAVINRVAASGEGTHASNPAFSVTLSNENTGSPETVLLPQEQLAGIKRYLSMNVTDLSKALQVARPTVYGWIRGVEPHDFNLERITQVYRISRSWRAMSSVPIGAYLNVRLPDRGSVIEQLSEERIDETAVSESFALIKAVLAKEPRRQSIADAAGARGLRAVNMRGAKKWSSDDDLNL